MSFMKNFTLLRVVLIVVAIGGTIGAFAADSEADAAMVRDLENNLIAPCCWSQPISQHPSEASTRMREEVRAMVAEGKTRDQILDHYVAQYGERILATPRPKGINLLAYILPWAALILGGWALFVILRKRKLAVPKPAAATGPDSRYDAVIEKELNDLDR